MWYMSHMLFQFILSCEIIFHYLVGDHLWILYMTASPQVRRVGGCALLISLCLPLPIVACTLFPTLCKQCTTQRRGKCERIQMLELCNMSQSDCGTHSHVVVCMRCMFRLISPLTAKRKKNSVDLMSACAILFEFCEPWGREECRVVRRFMFVVYMGCCLCLMCTPIYFSL